MPSSPSRILLVDDELSVRTSMSLVLVEFGYIVQLAEDGFSALRSIRREMPNILFTDLNMPGMSGFDLLTVVRRQFPALRTIAMSGAYSGSNVPRGVIADAFYPKGSGLKELLAALQRLAKSERDWPRVANATASFRIPQGDNLPSPDACVTVACPECLLNFRQNLSGLVDPILVAKCPHCHSSIHFAVAPSVDRLPLSALHSIPSRSEPAPRSATQP